MKLAMATMTLFAALAAGCDKQVENPNPIALDKIPPKIVEIAKAQLPGVDLEKAWTGKVDGETAYEIRGRKQNGQTKEVKILESGKVLEVE